jgi:hypothetical protein
MLPGSDGAEPSTKHPGGTRSVVSESIKKMNPTERLNRLAPAKSFALLHFPPHAPRLRQSGALQHLCLTHRATSVFQSPLDKANYQPDLPSRLEPDFGAHTPIARHNGRGVSIAYPSNRAATPDVHPVAAIDWIPCFSNTLPTMITVSVDVYRDYKTNARDRASRHIDLPASVLNAKPSASIHARHHGPTPVFVHACRRLKKR